ncbi:MAG TPA: hypothetical protein VFF06_35920 [Polyangia bacterium]|nr:hypothetical protein [Polyangia bacterium]
MRSTLLLTLIAAGCGNSYTYPGQDAAAPDLAASAPDLAAMNPADCDVIKQDCPVAPDTRCTIIQDPMMMGNDVHNCVAPKGSLTVGMPCTRTVFGDDDCAAGLVCTLRGVATGALICRKWCRADTDCAAGEQCSGQVSQAYPLDGMCIPTCAPFSSTCGVGLTCGEESIGVGSTMAKVRRAFLCRSAGTGVPGDPCMTGDECGPDQICTGSCVALCDDTHACAITDADAGAPMCNPLSGSTTGTCG